MSTIRPIFLVGFPTNWIWINFKQRIQLLLELSGSSWIFTNNDYLVKLGVEVSCDVVISNYPELVAFSCKLYTSFFFGGGLGPEDRIPKAVNLAQWRVCGLVSILLRIVTLLRERWDSSSFIRLSRSWSKWSLTVKIIYLHIILVRAASETSIET